MELYSRGTTSFSYKSADFKNPFSEGLWICIIKHVIIWCNAFFVSGGTCVSIIDAYHCEIDSA